MPVGAHAGGIAGCAGPALGEPRFAGRLYDLFPGGCVTYTLNFATGSQIALMEQFVTAVGLYPRQQLRLILKQQLGVELNP